MKLFNYDFCLYGLDKLHAHLFLILLLSLWRYLLYQACTVMLESGLVWQPTLGVRMSQFLCAYVQTFPTSSFLWVYPFRFWWIIIRILIK